MGARVFFCAGRFCTGAGGVYGAGTGPRYGVSSVGRDFSEEFCNIIILGVIGGGESLEDDVDFCRHQGQGIKVSV